MAVQAAASWRKQAAEGRAWVGKLTIEEFTTTIKGMLVDADDGGLSLEDRSKFSMIAEAIERR